MKDLLNHLWKQFRPPQALSWQTFVLLSLFSWAMSIATQTGFVRDLLARLGALFLTVGVAWGLAGVRINLLGLVIRPSHWIAGALACVFLFQGWGDPQENLETAIIWWPAVSVIIYAIPKFLPGLVLRIPPPAVRQELIILGLLSLVISSWLNFHFRLQDVLSGFPSLLADDFRRSAFVVRFDPPSDHTPRGATLLNQTEAILQEQLQGRSWSDAELWLLQVNQQMTRLKLTALSRMQPPLPEDNFWELRGVVQGNEPEYTLKLRAIWLGPSSRPGGYFLERVCRITQTTRGIRLEQGTITPASPQSVPPTQISQVSCDPVGVPIWIQSVQGGEG